MITTLRTGALSLSSVKYSFSANSRLTIEITTSANHKLYGDVKIDLSNVQVVNIYDNNNVLIENFFNKTFLFSRQSETKLVYSQNIRSGIAQSDILIPLENNGSSIIATVNNASIDLPAGSYNFLLLNADTEFSTSRIGIKQLNIAGSVDGIQSEYDNAGNADYLSINDLDASFKYEARVSIVSNTENTNIPLIINQI